MTRRDNTQPADAVPASELAARVADIAARNRGKEGGPRKSRTPTTPPKDKKGVLIQLPFWPDAARAVPNDLARSALFSVRNHNDPRKYVKNQAIAAFGDNRIEYTGEELGQDDEDVYMQIQHLARGQHSDDPVVFRPGALLKELGWANCGSTYTRLRDCIVRLSSNTLEINCRLGVFGGSLIRKFAYKPDHAGDQDPENINAKLAIGYWAIWLEPEMVQLFSPSAYTLLDWSQRLKLRPLAKWLHGYYKSHAEPFPIRVSTFHEKTGSKTKRLYHFRGQLRSSLDQLVAVGFLLSWRIDENDLVHVKRAPRD